MGSIPTPGTTNIYMNYIPPTSSYKLSKQDKTLLANILDPMDRAFYRHLLIQAELASQAQEKTRNKKSEKAEE